MAFMSNNFQSSSPITYAQVRPLIRWVYAWMGIGLLLTTIIAYFTNTLEPLQALQRNPTVVIGAIILELVVVLAIGFLRNRITASVAAVLFLTYAALNGFTISLIFLYYELGTITTAFGVTALLFGVMTIVGFTTNIDLTRFGGIFIMALIGLIIAMVVNIFLQSSTFDLIISAVGVLIFTGLVAYDTQKIKMLAQLPEYSTEGAVVAKLSIFGALTLYLDFINLFLFLLRLFGRRR
jgi:FtsH-binding integral membrane protein